MLVSRTDWVRHLAHGAFHPTQNAGLPYSALAFAADERDLRMLVQQAAFTIHRDAADFVCPTPILQRFVVPEKSKPHLRWLLRNAGISVGTLFPDLSNLADDIRSEYE
jgi:hypothetical protein